MCSDYSKWKGIIQNSCKTIVQHLVNPEIPKFLCYEKQLMRKFILILWWLKK